MLVDHRPAVCREPGAAFAAVAGEFWRRGVPHHTAALPGIVDFRSGSARGGQGQNPSKYPSKLEGFTASQVAICNLTLPTLSCSAMLRPKTFHLHAKFCFPRDALHCRAQASPPRAKKRKIVIDDARRNLMMNSRPRRRTEDGRISRLLFG